MQEKVIRSANIAIAARRRQRDGGYLLLAILLMMAMMIIAATVVAPRVVQQIKRDRELEMIHRGTEYARAIKKYYKKFGSYPTTLEQLDNTNQIRFLRKRYKDPLAKDGKWTLLHYGDIQTLLNPNTPGTPAAALGQGGSTPGGGGALGANSGFASGQQGFNSGAGFGQNNQFSGQPLGGGSTVGVQSQSSDYSGGSATNGAQSGSSDYSGSGAPGGQQGTSPFSSGPGAGPGGGANPNQPGGTVFGQNSAGGSQTFGAGAIVGVASVSKDPTIRIYNKKKKYNEWQFIYNPMMDQANVLLRGPYQPTTMGGAQVGTPAGQMNGQQQNGFGQQQNGLGQQQNGFGQSQSGSQNYSPDAQPTSPTTSSRPTRTNTKEALSIQHSALSADPHLFTFTDHCFVNSTSNCSR